MSESPRTGAVLAPAETPENSHESPGSRAWCPLVYALDFACLQRARQKLAELRTELKTTHDVPLDGGINVIAEARERPGEAEQRY